MGQRVGSNVAAAERPREVSTQRANQTEETVDIFAVDPHIVPDTNASASSPASQAPGLWSTDTGTSWRRQGTNAGAMDFSLAISVGYDLVPTRHHPGKYRAPEA